MPRRIVNGRSVQVVLRPQRTTIAERLQRMQQAREEAPVEPATPNEKLPIVKIGPAAQRRPRRLV